MRMNEFLAEDRGSKTTTDEQPRRVPVSDELARLKREVDRLTWVTEQDENELKRREELLAERLAEITKLTAECNVLQHLIDIRDNLIAEMCGRLSKRVQAADSWDRLVKQTVEMPVAKLN